MKMYKISAESCEYKLRMGLEKWISQEVLRSDLGIGISPIFRLLLSGWDSKPCTN